MECCGNQVRVKAGEPGQGVQRVHGAQAVQWNPLADQEVPGGKPGSPARTDACQALVSGETGCSSMFQFMVNL